MDFITGQGGGAQANSKVMVFDETKQSVIDETKRVL